MSPPAPLIAARRTPLGIVADWWQQATRHRCPPPVGVGDGRRGRPPRRERRTALFASAPAALVVIVAYANEEGVWVLGRMRRMMGGVGLMHLHRGGFNPRRRPQYLLGVHLGGLGKS
jgi:hypothetical protein